MSNLKLHLLFASLFAESESTAATIFQRKLNILNLKASFLAKQLQTSQANRGILGKEAFVIFLFYLNKRFKYLLYDLPQQTSN